MSLERNGKASDIRAFILDVIMPRITALETRDKPFEQRVAEVEQEFNRSLHNLPPNPPLNNPNLAIDPHTGFTVLKSSLPREYQEPEEQTDQPNETP